MSKDGDATMNIKRMGVQYAVSDGYDFELCRFNHLADAVIVSRYLSGQSLPETEEINALRLIREFDHRTERA